MEFSDDPNEEGLVNCVPQPWLLFTRALQSVDVVVLAGIMLVMGRLNETL